MLLCDLNWIYNELWENARFELYGLQLRKVLQSSYYFLFLFFFLQKNTICKCLVVYHPTVAGHHRKNFLAVETDY